MAVTDEEVLAPSDIEIVKWKVKKGTMVFKGSVLALYVDAGTENKNQTKKLKANHSGIVSQIVTGENTAVHKNDVLLVLQPQTDNLCTHPTIMKDMCAECGADLRSENGLAGDRKKSVAASVAMVHSIPELIVSQEQAMEIGKEDENRLLRQRKLVLLVDLDQTLIHTTNDNIPPNLKGVKHFQLFHGKDFMWYHTRFRPFTQQFLESVSKMYELHICTFGVRLYAHTIARLLDPEEKYFSHRILSRDECFDALSKTANLKALFPCGDKMVSIIDDREDVWNFAPNLIHVKPYRFFQGTADINAPPGLSKSEHDSEPIIHKIVEHSEVNKSCADTKAVVEAAKIGDDQPASDGTEMSSCDKSCEKASEVVAEPCDSLTPSESAVTSDNVEMTEQAATDVNIVQSAEASSSVGKTETTPSHDHSETKNKKLAVDSTESLLVQEIIDSKGDKCNTKDDKSETNTSEQSAPASRETMPSEKDDSIEWDDEDDYLLYLEEILTRIHKAYYDMYEQTQSKGVSELPDLKNIIPYVRKKVLKGANIVFSGLFPLNMPAEQSRAYIVAKALGANIQNDIISKKSKDGSIGEATTHLVASKPGTGKHKLALKTKGIHIVSGDWLWTCNERWTWVDERLFPLGLKEWKATPSPDTSNGSKKKTSKRKNEIDIDAGDSDCVFAECSSSNSKKQKIADSETLTEVSMEPSTSSFYEEAEPQRDVTMEPSTSSFDEGAQVQSKSSFATSFNPLYSLSDEDLELMDKEVDELMGEDEDSSEESDSEREARLRKEVLGKSQESDSDSDSLSGDLPRGWKLHRKSCSPKKDEQEEESQKRSDAEDDDETENELERYQKNIAAFAEKESSSDSSESEQSIGSVDDEIAEAVEKEFLGT
ncbi:RNA polymerase II subunit A C-terminal domain phosphatase [Biomphalaria pfeifferi]|uniref:RNA polymerase II subunit A C-terminal domain phosphatase n=1 Tax=Biomphalaria pfeifferi TaxID=112525 RepID=A0AAD8BBX6_BIOPF|nr:RNA polymerase II subunit A C-terminal domain phosphatase [Biomphalaria pfeifferi]